MCDGGDCRCEVSLQSYSPSNVELGLQNAHFWEVLGDFSVGGSLRSLRTHALIPFVIQHSFFQQFVFRGFV